MKKTKQIISFVLSLIMVITTIDFSVFTVNAAASVNIGGKSYTISGTISPDEVTTVRNADGDKVYELEGLETDMGYCFSGEGTTSSGSRITYSSLSSMAQVYSYDEGTTPSLSGSGTYAFTAKAGKKYLVKLSPNPSAGSTMTYSFQAVPHIKEVTFPFDKLVVYKGILYSVASTYSCDYLNFFEEKVQKMPGTAELMNGSTMPYTGYKDFGILQKSYHTYTYNESTGQYDVGNYFYYDSNIKQQPAGSYIIELQSVYNYTTLNYEISMPIEIRDITEMPLVYTKDADGNIVKNPIPWEDYLSNGDYTYFAADLEASKKYKLDDIQYGARFSMYDATGNFVVSGSKTYNQASSGDEISVPADGRYYFAGRKNITSSANVGLSEVGTATPIVPPTVAVGDKIKVNGTEATYKGELKVGDKIDMTGKTPELYEVSGFTSGLGYQMYAYYGENNVQYQSAPFMTGTFQKVSDDTTFNASANYYHVYPAASDKYYVLLQASPGGYNTYEIVSNKKVKTMTSDIQISIYEGMYLYDYAYAPYNVFSSMARKNPVKVTLTDGSVDYPVDLQKYGSFATKLLYEDGTVVDSSVNQNNLPAGKYIYKFTSPAELSIPYEVKARSEMPLVFYEEAGESISIPIEFEDWANTDIYSYFAANLKADKYYKFDISGDGISPGCAYFTLRDKEGKSVKDSLGNMTRRSAEQLFAVPEDGTYYFVAYDWWNPKVTAQLVEMEPEQITQMELATGYDYQKVHYKNYSYTLGYDNVFHTMQPTFKLTYANGEVKYTTYNDNYGMVVSGKVYKDDKTTEVSEEISKNEPGNYYAGFQVLGYDEEVLVPFFICDISEAAEELKLGENIEVEGYAAPDGGRSIKTYVYKTHLKAGVRTAFSSENNNCGFILYDERGKMLTYAEQEPMSYKAELDMDAYLVVAIWFDVRDVVKSYEQIEITEVKILSQPYKTTYYAGFDEYTSAGLKLEISYSDGVKEIIDSPEDMVILHNGEKLTIEVPKASAGNVGTYKAEIKAGSYEKTVYTGNYTVKQAPVKSLVFGNVLPIAKSANIRTYTATDKTEQLVNTDLGVIYQIDLVAGVPYEIDTNFYGGFAIYDASYTVEYAQASFHQPVTVAHRSFIPKTTGTYYIRVSADTATDLCVTKAESVTDAHIITQPFGSADEPYIIGLEPIRPHGMCIRITLNDGSVEDITYGDELWDKYVRSICYYQEDIEVENPKKEGTYTCKTTLLLGESGTLELTTLPFTRKWCIWDAEVLEDGKCVNGLWAEQKPVYIRLDVIAGTTYRVEGQNIKSALKLYAVSEGEYTLVEETTEAGEEEQQAITFAAKDNEIYILSYEDAEVGIDGVSLSKVEKIAEFALVADSIEHIAADYGTPLTLDGVRFALTYSGESAAKEIYCENGTYFYAQDRAAYLPGFAVKVFEMDKKTPVKKDASGFYPANKKGENYYIQVVANEPLESSQVNGSVWIPYTITGATADYTIVYNNSLARVQMVNPGAVITGSMANQVVAKDTPTKLSKNQFVFPGYCLLGFSTLESVGGIREEWTESDELFYPEEEVINLSKNGETVTLYAVWKKETYAVNYHMGGAKFAEGYDANRPLSVDGEEVTLPVVLNSAGEVDANVIDLSTIKGYSFGGWYADETYKKPIEKIAAGSTKNADVYAKWVPLQYHITFYGNGGKASVNEYTQDIYFDRSVVLKANAYKMDAKALLGWSIDETVLSTDIDHANYESYVMFGDKGNICINTENMDILDPDGDRNIKLYAIWGNWFSISYDLGGDGVVGDNYDEYAAAGLISMTDGLHPDHYIYGTAAKLDTKPVRKGYTFGGWYLDSAYKKKFTSISKKTAGNLKVYAKWTRNNYNIAFHANGGTGKMAAIKTYYYDSLENADNCVKVALPECTFAKKGYVFNGWKATIHGVETMLSPGDEVSNLIEAKGKTVTFYATWKLDTYQVSFVTNGGTITDAGIDTVDTNQLYRTTYQFDSKVSTIVMPIPSRAGYTFGGWFIDKTYKKQVKDMKGLAGDMELSAKWIADYTIVFDANGGEGIMADVKGNTGKAISLTNKFKKSGYAFVGWAVDGTTVVFQDKFALMSPDSAYMQGAEGNYTLNLKAVWKKDFNLTFVANCEGVSGLNLVGGKELTGYTYGNEITILPTPTRNGYAFNGWYSDAACKKKVTKIAKTDFGDKVFYAGWKPLNYNITFAANVPAGVKLTGKTSKQKMTYDVAKKLNKCGYKIPGYTFKGWALTPKGAVKYKDTAVLAKLSGSFRSEVTLYAVWEKDIYTISYNFGDGEIVEVTAADAKTDYYKKDLLGRDFMVRYEYGSSLATSQIPEISRMGYTFAGWYTDASCKKKFTGIKVGGTGSYTLYAKWTANK